MEYESRRFYGAFGLSFSLAGVTDVLVDKALRKPTPNAAIAAAAAAGVVGVTAGGKGVVPPAQQQPVGVATAASQTATSGVGGGGGGVGGWAEESRRIEAGEVLTRRALSALKVFR